MKFRKEDLQEMVRRCGPLEVVENHVVDNSRWSIHHEAIFKFDDKFYRVYYSVGATEMQCEYPFEYDEDEIECPEVMLIERTVMVYEEVKDASKERPHATGTIKSGKARDASRGAGSQEGEK